MQENGKKAASGAAERYKEEMMRQYKKSRRENDAGAAVCPTKSEAAAPESITAPAAPETSGISITAAVGEATVPPPETGTAAPKRPPVASRRQPEKETAAAGETPRLPSEKGGVISSAFDESRREESADLSDMGYLEVEVTTEREGMRPVPDAIIIVSKKIIQGELLIRVEMTDDNGKTETVPLPAPPAALSLNPETADSSYSMYEVSAYKRGFKPVINLEVPIFAAIKSIQPINFSPEQ